MKPTAKVFFADSRRLAQILPENSVDLIVTGPPYWNEVVYSDDADQLSKINDYPQFLAELSRVWMGCLQVLKDGSILAIWVHDFLRPEGNSFKYIPFHSDVLKTFDNSFTLRGIYVWDRYLNKDRGQITNNGEGIGSRIQYVIIFQKNGQGLTQKRIAESLRKIYWEPIWHKKTSPKFLGSSILFSALFYLGKWLKISDLSRILNKAGTIKDKYKFKDYPTECPDDIADLLISLFSVHGDLVLDPFAGSGTTLKSAIKLNRNCVGIEINKKSQSAIKNKLGELVTFC